MRRLWLKLLALSGWLLAAALACLYFLWPSPEVEQLRDEMQRVLIRAQTVTEMETALAAARRREAETAASLLRVDQELAIFKQQQTHSKLTKQAALAEANRFRAELQSARALSEQYYAEMLRLRREVVSQSALALAPPPEHAQPVDSSHIANVALLSLSEDGLVCAFAIDESHGIRESDSLALQTTRGQVHLVVTAVYPGFVLVRISSQPDSSVELHLGQNYSIYRI